LEDKVRMVGVRRWFVHARVDPTWASPGPPSPLSVPSRPSLPGSPASGTARVPAPRWKRRAIRRVRKRPRYGSSASASTSLLSMLGVTDGTATKFDGLLYTNLDPPVKRRAAGGCASEFCPVLSERAFRPLSHWGRAGVREFLRRAGRLHLRAICRPYPWNEAPEAWRGLCSRLASLIPRSIMGPRQSGRWVRRRRWCTSEETYGVLRVAGCSAVTRGWVRR
jgi:hypothetical protein